MKTLPDSNQLYQALSNRDTRLEGIFYFGVKTTGIFCRPGCSAKTPLRENVEYFDSIPSAMDRGYRPCKRCHPLKAAGSVPAWAEKLIDEVHKAPELEYRDEDLKQRGVDPVRIRRWFNQQYGMTFHSYLKALRLNRAFEKMKYKSNVTDAAFDSGYESISGFHEAFKLHTGANPSQSKHLNLVTLKKIPTELGPMIAGSSEAGLCFLEFDDRKMIDAQIEQLQQRMKVKFVSGQSEILEQTTREINEYFCGNRQEFTIPLDVQGTDFQQKAWKALCDIPYGETRSYKQQAIIIGNEKSVRAVASANAKNHIAIVVPCHRVIAGNGSLAGFGGGIWRKQFLLEMEASNREQSDRLI